MTRPSLVAFASSLCLFLVACGPATQRATGGDGGSDACKVGEVQDCYDGQDGTKDVGPCHGGTRTCIEGGTFTQCMGEVVPVAEVCGDGIDNNCSGSADENVDLDGDGYTTCGGDCCDSTECGDPKSVNPGAFDVPGDGVDNDCNGTIDDAQLLCDQGITSGTTNALDYAKAIDICQTATDADKKWGVIDAKFTKADGTGAPDAKQHAVLKKYGSGVLPHGGVNLMLLSTGAAAGVGDPNFTATIDTAFGASSAFPADFFAANGHKLPNAPGCPDPDGTTANDPVMLTLRVRVPTNANAFSLDTNFFSDEFPEYTCTPFNDFFVVLLDSTYSGSPANPTDKNLAFYTAGTGMKYPVGVNLASGNTGLFTECVNGSIGCAELGTGTITTCHETTELTGTGLDKKAPSSCDADSLMGGGTGWLTTSGNVVPGEIITIRIALWDTSDDALDSLAVIDNFKWLAMPSTPGTILQ